MKKHFYSDIVDIEKVILELEKVTLTKSEREELVRLAEETLHHMIIEQVLSELSEADKRVFLVYLVEESHDRIWKHLSEKIENIHEKITTTAEDVIQSLLDDLKQVQK